jgi:hypothetical protein
MPYKKVANDPTTAGVKVTSAQARQAYRALMACPRYLLVIVCQKDEMWEDAEDAKMQVRDSRLQNLGLQQTSTKTGVRMGPLGPLCRQSLMHYSEA